MTTIRRPSSARQVVSLESGESAPTSGPFTIGQTSEAASPTPTPSPGTLPFGAAFALAGGMDGEDGLTIPGPAGPSGISSGALLGVQVITTTGSGTYTPTAGTNSVIIELIGAGGGAGGCTSSAAGTNIGLAFPGQAGGYLRIRLTSTFSGGSYSVGALGTGGTAGANPGNDGGDTTFSTTTPTTYTAKGGKGGATTPGSFGPVWLLATNPSANSTSGGDISFSGSVGALALAGSAGNGQSGTGGSSPYSAGGRGASLAGSGSQSIAGGAASGYGGGGGGAISTNGGAAAAGGNGSNGIIIIYEYS